LTTRNCARGWLLGGDNGRRFIFGHDAEHLQRGPDLGPYKISNSGGGNILRQQQSIFTARRRAGGMLESKILAPAPGF
jgi:hypothetical protein